MGLEIAPLINTQEGNMIKLLKAIWFKNESKAYTELANVDWDKTCHLQKVGLSRFKHAIQSIYAGLYLYGLAMYAIFFHPIFPNIAPRYVSNKLKEFDSYMEKVTKKLKK